jgi:hypothetical protein
MTNLLNVLLWDANNTKEDQMYAKQITFRLSPALLRRLEKAAANQMRSVSSMIRLIIAENVPKYEGSGGSVQVPNPMMTFMSKADHH